MRGYYSACDGHILTVPAGRPPLSAPNPLYCLPRRARCTDPAERRNNFPLKVGQPNEAVAPLDALQQSPHVHTLSVW